MTDDQLARLVAMDVATVIHLEGANDWMLDARTLPAVDRADSSRQLPLLGRWRDFVDAGLHVASATDAPWTFEDFALRENGVMKELRIALKYYAGRPVIERLERVSKPGLRVYRGRDDIPRVMNGLGVAILSTSCGVMTDRKARADGVGGEVLCIVA